MCEEVNNTEVKKSEIKIIPVKFLKKDGKEVFFFTPCDNGRWQVKGDIPLNVAKKILLSCFSKDIWVLGIGPDLNPEEYAVISDEKLETISKNSNVKILSTTDLVSLSKKSGHQRFIKSYDVSSKFVLKYFIGLLKENGLVD